MEDHEAILEGFVPNPHLTPKDRDHLFLSLGRVGEKSREKKREKKCGGPPQRKGHHVGLRV